MALLLASGWRTFKLMNPVRGIETSGSHLVDDFPGPFKLMNPVRGIETLLV